MKGPFFLVQSLIPVFANPASVIMNASIFAHTGTPRSSVYSATKAAMLSFTKTMTSELLERGVRFNAISCAAVDTPLFDKLGIPDAYREQVTKDVHSYHSGRSLRSAGRNRQGGILPCFGRFRLDGWHGTGAGRWTPDQRLITQTPTSSTKRKRAARPFSMSG